MDTKIKKEGTTQKCYQEAIARLEKEFPNKKLGDCFLTGVYFSIVGMISEGHTEDEVAAYVNNAVVSMRSLLD